jgi:hypothetical protein
MWQSFIGQNDFDEAVEEGTRCRRLHGEAAVGGGNAGDSRCASLAHIPTDDLE